ncbi:MAG: LamG-like jellyroll fold domain-containing protein [Steroidobacteraceae bacterium]
MPRIQGRASGGWTVALALLCGLPQYALSQTSLRFYGDIHQDANRIKIRVDPHVPADVGATDFTIDFRIKLAAGNTSGTVQCGNNTNWIYGDIVIDRDRYTAPRAYGVSLGAGRIVWGIVGTSTGSANSITLCSNRSLNDGQWHHVALVRRRTDGFLWIYVDGALAGSADGPDGDISYPNGASSSATNDPYIVIGAEKHYTTGDGWREFRGWIDELRISTTLRWTQNFTPPSQPYVADGNTVLLLHMDDGSGLVARDASSSGTNAQLFYGGSPNPGPTWSSDTPFGAAPPPPPPPASEEWRVTQQTSGFQVVAVHTATNGTLGAQAHLGGIPAFVYAGSTSNRPTCNPADTAVSPSDGSTWMRVTAAAVDDYNHALGQNVSGYVRQCERVSL